MTIAGPVSLPLGLVVLFTLVGVAVLVWLLLVVYLGRKDDR